MVTVKKLAVALIEKMEPVWVRYFVINPDAYVEANLIGFYNIPEGCRHYPVQHLVCASSPRGYAPASCSHMAYFGFTDKLRTGLRRFAQWYKAFYVIKENEQ